LKILLSANIKINKKKKIKLIILKSVILSLICRCGWKRERKICPWNSLWFKTS